jgi:hypothetical protein
MLFRKVLELLRGLAANLKLHLDAEMLRQAMLRALEALAQAAGQTPSLWDDLVIQAAIAFVQSEAWSMLLELLLRQQPPAAATPRPYADLADSDLELALRQKFETLALGV